MPNPLQELLNEGGPSSPRKAVKEPVTLSSMGAVWCSQGSGNSRQGGGGSSEHSPTRRTAAMATTTMWERGREHQQWLGDCFSPLFSLELPKHRTVLLCQKDERADAPLLEVPPGQLCPWAVGTSNITPNTGPSQPPLFPELLHTISACLTQFFLDFCKCEIKSITDLPPEL